MKSECLGYCTDYIRAKNVWSMAQTRSITWMPWSEMASLGANPYAEEMESRLRRVCSLQRHRCLNSINVGGSAQIISFNPWFCFNYLFSSSLWNSNSTLRTTGRRHSATCWPTSSGDWPSWAPSTWNRSWSNSPLRRRDPGLTTVFVLTLLITHFEMQIRRWIIKVNYLLYPRMLERFYHCTVHYAASQPSAAPPLATWRLTSLSRISYMSCMGRNFMYKMPRFYLYSRK